jgi:hypothetical protein
MLKKVILGSALILALSVNAFAQPPYKPPRIHPIHHKIHHPHHYYHTAYNHRLVHRQANYHAATPARPALHTPSGVIPAQRAIPNNLPPHRGY